MTQSHIYTTYFKHALALRVNLAVGGTHQGEKEDRECKLGNVRQRRRVIYPIHEECTAPDDDKHHHGNQPSLERQ